MAGWSAPNAARARQSADRAARLSDAMQRARSLKEAAWMVGISERTARRLKGKNA